MSSEAPERSPSRGDVWRRLGAPDDQIGSVNDPRSQEEQGLVWNEKWVYLERSSGDGEARVARVVLWNHYDFVGSFRTGGDGSLTPEPLTEP